MESYLEDKHLHKKNHTTGATISKTIVRITSEFTVQMEIDTSSIFIAITYNHIKHCNGSTRESQLLWEQMTLSQ